VLILLLGPLEESTRQFLSFISAFASLNTAPPLELIPIAARAYPLILKVSVEEGAAGVGTCDEEDGTV
jgi:hypothetical protein